MKKLTTKYLLIIAILPVFLTGCYTQVATEDDSYSNYSLDEPNQDYVYEGEENTEGGYFDETDTLENYYYSEGDDGEIIVDNYSGYNPFYPDDDYDYYPSVNISFGFGFGYGYPYYGYGGYYYDDDHHHHHDDDWDEGAAFVTGMAVGAAMNRNNYVYSVPCNTTVIVGSVTYYHCSSTWYSRGYEGGEVVYIITSAPAGY